VVEGLVLALPTADFVTTAKPKMNIKAKVYKECETTNIIERRLIKIQQDQAETMSSFF
jgi:uncharacterized protein YaaW (UPF0174 family)